MKRNGLVFVPREPTKRVILYPTQDSASQQQQQQSNGLHVRAKTALVTTNHNETIQQSNNNTRLSRQQPFSSPPNGASKLPEKSDNDKTVPNTSGQLISLSAGQKVQNPYYANPFFRPKVVTNQPSTTTTNTTIPPPSRDSSSITTNVTIATLASSSITTATTTLANRGRQSLYPQTQNPFLLNNGRTNDSETTVITSPPQDDARRWAHTVASTPIVRRAISDERSNGTLKPPETNRAPINPGGSSAVNIFTRTGGIKDDSNIPGQTSTITEQLPNTPPFLTNGTSSTASNNNQNWKKALVANFQKNSRNNPTAKLFHSKQTTIPSQISTTINENSPINQQQKSDRTMIFNNDRTFQPSENAPTIPSLVRKSTESLRVIKQDNNNNIERSTSLQIQASSYSNTITTTINKTEEIIKPIEVSNSENVPYMPISIPSALITAKPPVNVEQQRAIITRVMIRRDFVKSIDSKPPMPTAPNMRSLIPPHSAKPGGLPTNNVIQVATITENMNTTNPNSNSNRIYPSQQQQQQQSSMPLSQKSLLAFTSPNPIIRESIKIDNNQQQLNGIINDGMTASSIMKMQQSQVVTNNSPGYRSISLSAASADSRRKKEEINNKTKKRAISASAISNDG